MKLIVYYLKLYILEKINNFNENNKWKLSTKKNNNYKIKFPFEIIYDFTVEIVNKAIDLIIPIINFMKKNKKVMDTLIICGGASLNNIINNIFCNNPSLQNINILRGKNPEVSIALGSVLYAFEPFTIAERKAENTLGIKCSIKLDILELNNFFQNL